MTEQDQIKALAELDGWDAEPTTMMDGFSILGVNAEKPHWSWPHQLPQYLTSYDAIVPLIQKQDDEVKDKIGHILDGGVLDKNSYIGYIENPAHITVDLFVCATPQQLCEALLRATGKWKD